MSSTGRFWLAVGVILWGLLAFWVVKPMRAMGSAAGPDSGPSPKSIESQIQDIRSSCQAFPCGALGLYYSRIALQVEGDPAAETFLLRHACQDDYFWACFQLGEIYRDGTGVDVDSESATRLFKEACEAGEMRACLAWGELLEVGDQDLSSAREIYSSACQEGSARGCWLLASLLEQEEDPAAVQDALRRACTGGMGKACFRWGQGLHEGFFGPPDQSRAAEAFSMSCDRKYLKGCVAWAHHLQSGIGVPADPEFAQRLLKQACEKGHSEACAPTSN